VKFIRRESFVRFFLVVLIGSIAGSCLGASIHAYKSVHADGTVEYSDTRPASAAPVDSVSVAGPDAASDEQGKQYLKELDESVKRLDEQQEAKAKAQRDYQSRLSQAQRELQEAEKGLASARESKKNATPERIAVAEQRVQLARQRLREVQNAAPRSSP